MEVLLKSDANAVTLAKQLDINISAVRSHLDVLEIAGLLSSRHEHAKRGRPKRLYSLTPLAHKLFPQRTGQIMSTLLRALTTSLDVKTIDSLISQISQNLWQLIIPKKPTGNLKERIRIVVDALDLFGFYASFESTEKGHIILILNDVFEEALTGIPEELGEKLYREFWQHLSDILGFVQIQRSKPSVPTDHELRILVTEGREK